jgi:hypothetical protein
MPDTTPNYQCQDTERVETPNVPREDLAWLDDLDSCMYTRCSCYLNQYSLTLDQSWVSSQLPSPSRAMRDHLTNGTNSLDPVSIPALHPSIH